MQEEFIEIIHDIIDGIEDRSSFFSPTFQRVLIVYDGLDTDLLLSILSEKIQSMEMLMHAEIDWIKIEPYFETVKIAPLNKNYNLIITTPFLQRVIDVPGVLLQMRVYLAPNGVLVSPFIGNETMECLKKRLYTLDLKYHNGIQQRFFPMISMNDAGRLLVRAGFDSCVSDFIRLYPHFQSIRHFKKTLQFFNENHILRPSCYLSNSSTSKLFNHQYISDINQSFDEFNDQDHLFLDIVYIIGWLNPVHITSSYHSDVDDIAE
ncbi:MAG: hypothetical protein C0432_03985 [Candidatus Puniceispirillum sp.]|nr:hypothetical protein [Candidatus Pelagibacter sp.]MBA4283435.1 hypothetical protein [Candidatus Puniceispirillum sp.]